MEKKIKVTLKKRPATERLRIILLGLGLKKTNSSRALTDTPPIRGMIGRVSPTDGAQGRQSEEDKARTRRRLRSRQDLRKGRQGPDREVRRQHKAGLRGRTDAFAEEAPEEGLHQRLQDHLPDRERRLHRGRVQGWRSG